MSFSAYCCCFVACRPRVKSKCQTQEARRVFRRARSKAQRRPQRRSRSRGATVDRKWCFDVDDVGCQERVLPVIIILSDVVMTIMNFSTQSCGKCHTLQTWQRHTAPRHSLTLPTVSSVSPAPPHSHVSLSVSHIAEREHRIARLRRVQLVSCEVIVLRRRAPSKVATAWDSTGRVLLSCRFSSTVFLIYASFWCNCIVGYESCVSMHVEIRVRLFY